MSSGRNIGNITEDINKTVIKGTPLQNSINPIEIYLIIGRSDLLPKDKNKPTGKQNIKQNIGAMDNQTEVKLTEKKQMVFHWKLSLEV